MMGKTHLTVGMTVALAFTLTHMGKSKIIKEN